MFTETFRSSYTSCKFSLENSLEQRTFPSLTREHESGGLTVADLEDNGEIVIGGWRTGDNG